MDYKGYHIIAEISVNEGWDFTESAAGGVELTEPLYSGNGSDGSIANFTIEDIDGGQLDEYPETLAEAKATIDKHIKEHDQRLRSDCYHAAVERRDPERADWYYRCTVCGEPCDIEEVPILQPN